MHYYFVPRRKQTHSIENYLHRIALKYLQVIEVPMFSVTTIK
jgi:hypothetical protein